MNRVIFFNHFHNGDIHASRQFIRLIVEKLAGCSFYYWHKNDPCLLADIPDLQHIKEPIPAKETDTILRIGDDIYFNTWYGQGHQQHLKRFGITIDCLYAAFDSNLRTAFNLGLFHLTRDFKHFYPSIDFEKFAIQSAQHWLSQHSGKKVFVANGKALSHQAHNFALTPIIIHLAQRHRDKIFLLSNLEGEYRLPDNVVYTSEIIGKNGCDLNENAFLASACDVIVGRASGAFSFALTQDNLFHHQKTFISFSNLIYRQPNQFWTNSLFRDKVQYQSKIIMTNETSTNTVMRIIEEQL